MLPFHGLPGKLEVKSKDNCDVEVHNQWPLSLPIPIYLPNRSMKLAPYHSPCIKIKSKCFNVKPETMRPLEENIGNISRYRYK